MVYLVLLSRNTLSGPNKREWLVQADMADYCTFVECASVLLLTMSEERVRSIMMIFVPPDVYNGLGSVYYIIRYCLIHADIYLERLKLRWKLHPCSR